MWMSSVCSAKVRRKGVPPACRRRRVQSHRETMRLSRSTHESQRSRDGNIRGPIQDWREGRLPVLLGHVGDWGFPRLKLDSVGVAAPLAPRAPAMPAARCERRRFRRFKERERGRAEGCALVGTQPRSGRPGALREPRLRDLLLGRLAGRRRGAPSRRALPRCARVGDEVGGAVMLRMPLSGPLMRSEQTASISNMIVVLADIITGGMHLNMACVPRASRKVHTSAWVDV